MDNLQKTTEKNTSDIRTLEEAVIKLTTWLEETRKHAAHPTGSTTFWDLESKKLAIRLTFIFALIIVSILAGVNVWETLQKIPT